MKTRFYPESAAIWLALVLVALIIATSAGASHARSTSAPSATQVWVRQDSPVINVNGDPLRYEYPDPRFAGSFTQYSVAETAIGKEERFIDHEIEYYHVTIDTAFDRPPLVLNPPLRYKLHGSYSHGGVYNGGGMVGAKLFYAADLATIEPATVQGYFPWEPWYEGNATTEWMISAPPANHVGQTMTVTAGWMDCPPCNVTWTYRAEPATDVEQLEVEVVAPVVEYQGEEVPLGETFYPDTCDLPGGRKPGCGKVISMTGIAALNINCAAVEHYDRLLLLLQLLDIFPDQRADLYFNMLILKDRCGLLDARAEGDFQIGLSLERGAILLDNVIASQTVSVHTGVGTATADRPGTFAAGYLPESEQAVFRAYSAPLAIQSATGLPFTLQPGEQVGLTPEGFGSVTSLPRVLLPVAIR